MDVRELRRAQLARETWGYLAIPAIYFALMAVGVFRYLPEFALFTLVLVGLLILQSRAGRIASSVAKRTGAGSKAPPRVSEAVEAADERFLVFVNYTVLANLVGYLVFLALLDVYVKEVTLGHEAGPTLLAGVALGLTVVLAGKEAARRAAWGGYAARFPTVWQSPTGFDNGRGVRTPAAYLDWRVEGEGGS